MGRISYTVYVCKYTYVFIINVFITLIHLWRFILMMNTLNININIYRHTVYVYIYIYNNCPSFIYHHIKPLCLPNLANPANDLLVSYPSLFSSNFIIFISCIMYTALYCIFHYNRSDPKQPHHISLNFTVPY